MGGLWGGGWVVDKTYESIFKISFVGFCVCEGGDEMDENNKTNEIRFFFLEIITDMILTKIFLSIFFLVLDLWNHEKKVCQ